MEIYEHASVLLGQRHRNISFCISYFADFVFFKQGGKQ